MSNKNILKIHAGLVEAIETQAEKEEEIDNFKDECTELFDEMNTLFLKIDEFIKSNDRKLPPPIPAFSPKNENTDEGQKVFKVLEKLMVSSSALIAEMTEFKTKYDAYMNNVTQFRTQASEFFKLLETQQMQMDLVTQKFKDMDKRSKHYSQEIYKLIVLKQGYAIRLEDIKKLKNYVKGAN